MKGSEYGLINKKKLVDMIEELRVMILDERNINKKIQTIYERQLDIQDKEIQRLNDEITLLKAKLNERGCAQ